MLGAAERIAEAAGLPPRHRVPAAREQTQETAAECLVDPEDDLGIGTVHFPEPHLVGAGRRTAQRVLRLAGGGGHGAARLRRQARVLGADAPRAGHHRPPRLRLLLPDGRPGRRRRTGDGDPGRRARLRGRVPGQPPARHRARRPGRARAADGAVPVHAAGRAARHRHRRGVRAPAGGLPRDHRPLRRRAGRDRRHARDLPGAARRSATWAPRCPWTRPRSTGSPRPSRTSGPATPAPRWRNCPNCGRWQGRRSSHGRLWELVEALDALPRGIAMHPCGVLLSDASLLRRTPVMPTSGEGFPCRSSTRRTSRTSGCSSSMCSACGCSRRWRTRSPRSSGPRASGSTWTRCRRATRRRIDSSESAETLGCFQIESPGQRDLVGRLQPATFHDLVVDISLFRPGPVAADMVRPFIEARHGRAPVRYPHPDLERRAARDVRGRRLPRADHRDRRTS